ncbi:hypothetical protein NA57DRAFT_72890 [Rhizodiscina lignyota]|uniref:DUF7730 domain-containing protein n=1 Tax=Rhizodiscina lignyota TaxID=1504668 RepID=A0A9P4IN26_9PEZI|nr:hypothetical protein NA57DRAFT_72890 [Rhizodiscina lignyota]
MKKIDTQGVKKRAKKYAIAAGKFALHASFLICFKLWCICCSCSLDPNAHGFCGTGRIQERRFQRERKEMLSRIPRPLNQKRTRRLTLPTEGKDGMEGKLVGWRLKRQKTKAQEGSKLLMLPAEIREMIWGYVMGGKVVGLVNGVEVGRKRVGFGKVKRLGFDEMVESEDYYNETGPEGQAEYNQDATMLKVVQESDWRPLSVLLSCRQIYSETIHMLYSHDRFHFTSCQTLIDFTMIILRPRLSLITTISLAAIVQWRDHLPQYTLEKAIAVILPPADPKSYYTCPKEPQRSGIAKLFSKRGPTCSDRPFSSLQNVELSVDCGPFVSNALAQFELPKRWGDVYTPIIALAEGLASKGGELIVSTSWQENNFETMSLGPGGSKISGLRMVRPRENQSPV